MGTIDICDHEYTTANYRIKAQKIIIAEDGYTRLYEDVYIILYQCDECDLVINIVED